MEILKKRLNFYVQHLLHPPEENRMVMLESYEIMINQITWRLKIGRGILLRLNDLTLCVSTYRLSLCYYSELNLVGSSTGNTLTSDYGLLLRLGDVI